MGASDYAVGNAPQSASYAAPLAGFAFGQALGNLPEEYFKGTQRKRALELQKPILDPNTGEPTEDSGVIMKELMKRGGAEYSKELIPFLQSNQFLAQAARTQPPTIGGADVPNAGGPAAVTQRPQQPQGQPQGQPQTAGEDGPTINYVVQNSGRQLSPQQIFSLARVVGINPNAPLNPEQVAKVQSALKDLPTPGRVASSEDVTPPAGPSSAAERGVNGPNGANAEALPAGGADGSPGPNAGPPAPFMGSGTRAQAPAGGAPAALPPNAAPAQGTVVARWPNYTPEAAANGLPANWNEKTAGNFEKYARGQADLAAASATTNPAMSKVFQERSTQAAATAKMIREKMAEAAAFTGGQKEARDPSVEGFKRREAQIKDDTTRYGKQLSAIQGSAQASNRMLQHIQLAEGIYNNPNFYSGAGEGLNLMYKRVVNALNPNNTEALPQEAFRKTMAASVLNQVEQLKDDTSAVGGGGRIFQAQIELMEKAANNPDNSIPANRLLTEVAKRGALESKRIAEMANKYNGGHLDAGFAQMVDDHYTQHPMFTPAEMQDIRLIAPPVAPKLDSEKQATAWARKAGLKPGDPMKLPSGRIVPAP